MTTAHQLIRLAVVDLLKTDPPVAAGVYPNRSRAIGVEADTAVVVLLGRAAAESSSMGGRTSWSTLLQFECYGRNDDAADAILEALFARLEADSSLCGRAMDIEPLAGDTLQWDYEQLDNNLVCITAKFVVRHQTNARILTI